MEKEGTCEGKTWQIGAIWGCSLDIGHEGAHRFSEILADAPLTD